MSSLAMVRPSVRYRASFLDAVREVAEPDQRSLIYTTTSIEMVASDFPAYIDELLVLETSPPRPLVRDTVWWGVAEDRFVGRISFRHELNEHLRTIGGHIGYVVRLSERRKGYASEMLRQALATELARRVGEILITCDEDNLPSIRVIARNGGVPSGHYDPGEGGPRTLHFTIRAT
jgi:predicted acetyltransferase